MKKFLVFLMMILSLHFSFGQCVPDDVTSSDVSKAVAMVSYKGFKFTGCLVNNVNEDGRLFFMTSYYPFNALCGISAATSGHINNITFKWVNGSTTSGATLLSTSSSEVALLELDGNPPFDTYSLVGFNNNPNTNSYCISNYDGVELKKVEVNEDSTGYISSYCLPNGSNSYSFTSGVNNAAYIVKKWDSNKNLKKLNYTKGAPLFNADGEVVGMYVTKTIDTACGTDYAYFLKTPSNHGNLFSYLGNTLALRGIKYTPCEDVIVKDLIISAPKTEEASIRIIGKSKIDDVAVIFRAGEEVILDNGFDSGNNFIAEIAPCFAKVEEIAAKTNDENNSQETSTSIEIEKSMLKAYPTVIIDDKLTLESTNLDTYEYIIYNISGKVIKKKYNVSNSNEEVQLPEINNGIYFLKVNAFNYTRTIKLLKK
ncbi:MAG: T9SS type A sorting domain-containing protein [Chitinophagales bacterium]